MPAFREIAGQILGRQHAASIAVLAAERDVFATTIGAASASGVHAELAADLCRGRVATLTPKDGAWIGFVTTAPMTVRELGALEVDAPADLMGYEGSELGVVGSLHSLPVLRSAQVFASPVRRSDGTTGLILIARVPMTGDEFREFAHEHGVDIPLLTADTIA